MAACGAVPLLPGFPDITITPPATDVGLMSPRRLITPPAPDVGLMFAAAGSSSKGRANPPAVDTSMLPSSPSPAAGSGSKGGKLKRQHTNVEPIGAMSSACSGQQALPSVDFLMPSVPSAMSKRPRDGGLNLPVPSVALGSDVQATVATPNLRRTLTPRISWSTILNDASDDVLMCCESLSPVGRSSTRKPQLCPSPPPRSVASPFGSRAAASSPPPRPEKLRSFALRAPPTPLGNRAASVENWEGGNRFTDDFEDARVIGSGSFAVVYRARNKIDKQEYAIKKTKKTLGRSARRQEMLQEALALASVAIDSPCLYIVRYFASWVEDERLFIQTELCDGSLKDCMLELRQTRPHDPRLSQEQLSLVIRDVCSGLAVLHGKNLVHLDVKPENILVKHLVASSGPNSANQGAAASKIHKIADFGLATAAMGSGCDEINEGDSRYLAREVLQGNFSDLTKADVFSLGLTCYELATNPKELPCNGEEWHRLRDGCIEDCFANHLSPATLALIRCMVHPVAAERPPCVEVLEHEAICLLRPKEIHSSAEVVQELQSQLRRQTEAAEREQKRRASAEEKADRYWSELLHMKRQALTGDQSQASPEQPHVPSPPKEMRGYKRSLTM